MTRDYMTVPEAAEYLGFTHSGLWRLVKKGAIASVRLSKLRRGIRLEEVERFLKEGRIKVSKEVIC